MPTVPTSPDVSVIVPAHNAARTLGDQLDALAEQRFDGAWEVVVVDDRSTDATPLVAAGYRDRFSSLRIVATDRQRNAAHARNVGVGHARGSRLLFCDADDVVGDGWLAALARALEDDVFVVARMEVDRLNPVWAYAHRSERQTLGPQIWATHGRSFLAHAGAGTVGLRRELYEELGPFDERFDRCEGPGPEYCFRVQLAGYPLTFVEEAVVHVRLRTDAPSIYRQSRDWAEWTVAIEQLFESHGLARPARVRDLAACALVLPRLVRVRNRADLIRWLRLLAWRVGRIRGIVRFRRSLAWPARTGVQISGTDRGE